MTIKSIFLIHNSKFMIILNLDRINLEDRQYRSSFYLKSKGNIILNDLDFVSKKMPNKISLEYINEKEKVFNIRLTYDVILILKLKVHIQLNNLDSLHFRRSTQNSIQL